MLGGVALIAIAGLGLLRLPDAYTRLNTATKAASLGIAAVLAGVALLLPGPANAVKLVLALVLQLMTAPVGAYAIARAAHHVRTPQWEGTRYDRLNAGPDGPVERSPEV